MVEIEDNIIEVLPDTLERIFHKVAEASGGWMRTAARGGLQLAGGCEHVRVAGNVIVGGTGNGITLGNILRIDHEKSRRPSGSGYRYRRSLRALRPE